MLTFVIGERLHNVVTAVATKKIPNSQDGYRRQMMDGKMLTKIVSLMLVNLMLLSASGDMAHAAPRFNIGDTVEVQNTLDTGLRVRDFPAGNPIGRRFDGDRGVILEGPEIATLEGITYTWWRIQWEDAVVGWSAERFPEGVYYLREVPALFDIGDTVEVQNTLDTGLRVRDFPAGNPIGGRFDGDRGVILERPKIATLEGITYTWWRIQWEDAVVGWSAEGFPEGVYYLRGVEPVQEEPQVPPPEKPDQVPAPPPSPISQVIEAIVETMRDISDWFLGLFEERPEQSRYIPQYERPLLLGEKAASLAKEVIGDPYLGDGRIWGGKGWDTNQRRFVDHNQMEAGYHYFHHEGSGRGRIEWGAGVDCSGLVFWSFNRAWEMMNDQRLRHPDNYQPDTAPHPIFYQGVSRQWGDLRRLERLGREIPRDLRPGDLLFFLGDPFNHVAIYVGNFLYDHPIGGEHYHGTFNVIHASLPRGFVIPDRVDDLINWPTFVGFGRVQHIDNMPGLKPPEAIAHQEEPVALEPEKPEQVPAEPGPIEIVEEAIRDVIDWISNLFRGSPQ